MCFKEQCGWGRGGGDGYGIKGRDQTWVTHFGTNGRGPFSFVHCTEPRIQVISPLTLSGLEPHDPCKEATGKG